MTSTTKTKKPFPVHELSFKAIRVDPDVQSRAAVNLEFERRYMERYLDIGIHGMDPVVVFFDGKFHWLADGFHRLSAARKANLDSILAEVRPGGRRDAMIHSAGSNYVLCAPRSKEDIRRAARILFADEEWANKPDLRFAEHLHVGATMIRRLRLEYCEETGREPPERIVDTAGNERPYQHKHGSRKQRAIQKLRTYGPESEGFYGRSVGRLKQFLETRGIQAKKGLMAFHGEIETTERGHAHIQGLFGLIVEGMVVTPIGGMNSIDLVSAIGRVVTIRAMYGKDCLGIILCPLGCLGLDHHLVAAADKLNIDFMSANDLVNEIADMDRKRLQERAAESAGGPV